MVILDMKGELAAISVDQTPNGKYCVYWNPCGLHGLGQDRINPTSYATIDSPSLISDIKVFAQTMIETSGSPQAEYFEGNARRYLEAIALTIVKRDGVLTMPALYEAINLIPGGTDAWLDLAFDMQESGFPVARSVEEEIATSRTNGGNGFQGILGELLKCVAELSDPQLMASVSPPFTFCISQMTFSDDVFQFYIMPPAEFIQAWRTTIKVMLAGAMLYKSRAPQAPQQTWILDECAQLGAFGIIPQLFTYGAGIGIRPVAVFQSDFQMKALGPNADSIIKSSAAMQIYFAIRDIQTASSISNMIGSETLAFDDERLQAQADLAKRQAMQSFMSGGDPFNTMMTYKHQQQASTMQSQQQRQVRTPDEVLNTPEDKLYLFTDLLPSPLYAERKPYYEQRFMAGRYHPNPYHPPLDRVRVKTRFGHAWKRIINAPVPNAYAHYPQYRDGTWSYVEK